MPNTDKQLMIDRETYRKIKKMSHQEMQAFLMRYADELTKNEHVIDLRELEAEIRNINGIGEKRYVII